MDLVPYIRELILLNECVILRGVGGFETQYKHATLDKKLNVITPPSKQITFRPDWIQDNGVLEEHLVQSLGIQRDRASELIDSFSKEFYQQLKEKEEITLDGIGIFSFDKRLILQFKELDEANYLADSFGLDTLEIQTGNKTVRDDMPEVLTPVSPEKRQFTGWYIAIGVLVLVILITGIILISGNSTRGIGWETSGKGKSGVDNEMLIIGSDEPDRKDPVLESIERNLDTQTQPQNALAPTLESGKQSELGAQSSKYYLIAGSFRSMRNAEILRAQLYRKGFTATIQETGTNYRVIIGEYTARREAINELRRMRSQLDQSVWLLEVKN